MSPARPLPRLCPWVWTFFFCFFVLLKKNHSFFACFSCEYAFITVPLKKCAFLQFAHLRPPGQTAKKTWKNQKNQKVQTHVPCQASPQTLSMGLFFFCFFLVFSRFGLSKLQKKETTKNKIKHKVQTYVPCLPCPWVWFFVFFGYLVVLATLQNPWQNQNKQKNKEGTYKLNKQLKIQTQTNK